LSSPSVFASPPSDDESPPLEPPHAANESTIAVLSKTAKTFFFIVYIPPLNNELLFI
jgi:hypothetical protein